MLFGDNGPDVTSGGRGHDHIEADGGSNTLYGRAGRDYLLSGPVKDRLFGGKGDDHLRLSLFGENRGRDVVDCGPGDDTVAVEWGGSDDTIADNCEHVYEVEPH